MGYRELIKKVQLRSGFSDSESEEALDHTVEIVAAHLTDGERDDFASQLPEPLKGMALSVMPLSRDMRKADLLHTYIETSGGALDEPRAKKQLLSAWRAIKEAVSPGELKDVRAQLSQASADLLH